MPKQERVTPSPSNHEAERMQEEARQRQEAAEKAGKVSVGYITAEETAAMVDMIDESMEENGIHTAEEAQAFIDASQQKGGE